jgi:hypothetical protein
VSAEVSYTALEFAVRRLPVYLAFNIGEENGQKTAGPSVSMNNGIANLIYRSGADDNIFYAS